MLFQSWKQLVILFELTYLEKRGDKIRHWMLRMILIVLFFKMSISEIYLIWHKRASTKNWKQLKDVDVNYHNTFCHRWDGVLGTSLVYKLSNWVRLFKLLEVFVPVFTTLARADSRCWKGEEVVGSKPTVGPNFLLYLFLSTWILALKIFGCLILKVWRA